MSTQQTKMNTTTSTLANPARDVAKGSGNHRAEHEKGREPVNRSHRPTPSDVSVPRCAGHCDAARGLAHDSITESDGRTQRRCERVSVYSAELGTTSSMRPQAPTRTAIPRG